MKNAAWAWVTIGIMGLGTAAAASHAVKIERAASQQARVQPVKKARQAKPARIAAESATEFGYDEATVKSRPVRPTPRNPVDTRQLSRMSQRQA